MGTNPSCETNADTAMLSAWVDEHADSLYRFALRRVSDPHVIEDLLQETFLAAVKAHANFRGDSSVRTWLIAILKLKIIDHYRKTSKSQIEASQAMDWTTKCYSDGEPIEWDCDPAATVENEEFWSAFYQCIDNLPPALAQCYLLQEVDQKSTGEVSKLLGITKRNLAVRIYRARVSLRQCLEKLWFASEQ